MYIYIYIYIYIFLFVCIYFCVCMCIYIYIYIHIPDIGLVVRVFANGPGDLGSIPSWVIPKTQKWYLMPPCLTLSIIRYRSRVKWSNPAKGVAPSPTHWCSKLSKREPSGHPRLWSPTMYIYIYIFFFCVCIYIYIYIYIFIFVCVYITLVEWQFYSKDWHFNMFHHHRKN